MADTDTTAEFSRLLVRAFTEAGLRIEQPGPVPLPAGHSFVVTTDSLVAGRHFPLYTDAADIGYKSLAVNLSDLAAMGAVPVGSSLVLVVPEARPDWLQCFAAGWAELASTQQVPIVDLQCLQGALAVHVHAYGALPGSHSGLLRANAHVGERIFVTGTLGDAAAALAGLRAGGPVESRLLSRLNRPTPRLAAGQALRDIAGAAIDVSDGLAADLHHLCTRSRVAARVELQRLPVSAALRDTTTQQQCWQYACSGGDDYELCFTLPDSRLEELNAIRQAMQVDVSMIGEIVAPGPTCDTDVVFYTPDGERWSPSRRGYEHFVTDETET